MTQIELSKQAKLKKGVVQMLETEKSWPESQNLESIAHALGVSPYRLLMSPDEIKHHSPASKMEQLIALCLKIRPHFLDAALVALDAIIAHHNGGNDSGDKTG